MARSFLPRGDDPADYSNIFCPVRGVQSTTAFSSVLRVVCPARQSSGTGFLHKSGKVITVFHVVSGCAAQDIVLLGVQGQPIKVTDVVVDACC